MRGNTVIRRRGDGDFVGWGTGAVFHKADAIWTELEDASVFGKREK